MVTMETMAKPVRLPKPERPALTVNQAAAIAGVSRDSIIDYYNAGILKGYRKSLGQTSPIMIYVDSLEKFMRDRKQK